MGPAKWQGSQLIVTCESGEGRDDLSPTRRCCYRKQQVEANDFLLCRCQFGGKKKYSQRFLASPFMCVYGFTKISSHFILSPIHFYFSLKV